MSPREHRELRAIMFTDIADFTRITAGSERRAVELLDQQRTLIKPLVEEFGGNWLKELGDGVLLSFHSTIDALECAVEIQKQVQDVKQLDLRIAIHQGDIVILKNDDIIGDDVNITSRMVPFSAVGGIAVSEKVTRDMSSHPEFEARFLVEPQLKGVKKIVRIYSVVSHGLPQPSKKDFDAKYEKKNPLIRPVTYIAGIVLLLSYFGYTFYFRGKGGAEVKTVLKDDKSIAVLPFMNMSGDTKDEYFSDGITEEILNRLSKVEAFRIISRTSAFSFKDKMIEMEARQIADLLSVNYIVEGSVRKWQNNVRINTSLIRAYDDKSMWSGSYERNLENIFTIQDEIASAIAEQLKVQFGEIKGNISTVTTANSSALNNYLLGRNLWNKKGKQDLIKAIDYFNLALKDDPGYAQPYIGLAESYIEMNNIAEHINKGSDDDDFFPRAETNARRALELAPEYGEAYTVLAKVAEQYRKDPEQADDYYQKAIRYNPNYSISYLWYGTLLWKQGRTDAAFEKLEKAGDLDPLSATINARIGRFHYTVNKDYVAAYEYYTKAFEIEPDFIYGFENLFYIDLLERQLMWDKAEGLLLRTYEADSVGYGALVGLSRYYLNMGSRQQAIKYYNKFYSTYFPNYIALNTKIDSLGLCEIYQLDGDINFHLNKDYGKALDLYFKSLELIEEIQDPMQLVNIYYCIHALKNEEKINEFVEEILYDMYGDIPNEIKFAILGMDAGYSDDETKVTGFIKMLDSEHSQNYKNYALAFIFTSLDEAEYAVESLEFINEYKLVKDLKLLTNPIFDPIQEDSEFIRLIKKTKLKKIDSL